VAFVSTGGSLVAPVRTSSMSQSSSRRSTGGGGVQERGRGTERTGGGTLVGAGGRDADGFGGGLSPAGCALGDFGAMLGGVDFEVTRGGAKTGAGAGTEAFVGALNDPGWDWPFGREAMLGSTRTWCSRISSSGEFRGGRRRDESVSRYWAGRHVLPRIHAGAGRLRAGAAKKVIKVRSPSSM
jgi:hypothetical protein